MVVGGGRQETLLIGTHQQGVPVILTELVLPDGFDSVSPSFTSLDIDQLNGYSLMCITYHVQYFDYVIRGF
ncbi:unnamed protein product [Schistosoma margrebowiei]|uniref:Uncharacterized protein n=1 Tax=Schistosoma margrebowiei TaxID=48269 RepID=A0A183LVQ8_9TREM|nr:unnamed protein product [Schistosoma margrebowiei]